MHWLQPLSLLRAINHPAVMFKWLLYNASAVMFDYAPLPSSLKCVIRDAAVRLLQLMPDSTQGSSREQHGQKQETPAPLPLHISWPGFGVLFFWQLGILKYLTQHFNMSQLHLVGSSAGGLLCLLAACDVDPKAAVQHAHDLCVRTGVFNRPWGLAGVWGGLVRTWLQELLPSDAAERCSGRVTVVVTELPWLATRSISSFRDREDLIDVALASAHVPLFLDGRVAARCRGRWCIDGSFCYILFRRTMGLIPQGAKVLLFDPWSDKKLRSSWGWGQCLELLGLPGAMRLLDCGYAHAQTLHSTGLLEQLPLLVVAESDAAVVIGEQSGADCSDAGKAAQGAEGACLEEKLLMKGSTSVLSGC